MSKECKWNTGGKCEGEIESKLMFGGQLSISICEACFGRHQKTMFLHAAGLNIEDIVNSDNIDELYEEELKKHPELVGNVEL